MTGSVTFTPTEADVIAATRANALRAIRRPRALRNGAIITIGAGVLATVVALFVDRENVWLWAAGGLAYGLLVWGVILLLSLLLLPGRTRRQFRQHRTLQKTFEYRWSDEGLAWSSEHGGAQFPWGDLHGWRESSSTFMIYSNDMLFQFLPRHAFEPGMEDDLRATLVRSGLPVY